MTLTTAAIIILSLWVVAIVAAGLVMALRPGGVGVRFPPMTAQPSSDGAARQEIRLGGEAEVLGNVRGRVVAVLIRPDSRRIEAVQLGGGLLEAETIPASAIVDADGRVLSLTDGWPEQTTDPDGSLATLRENMSVVGANGKRLGRLRVVCFDAASTTATELVVEGGGQPNPRLVPMDRVMEAAPDRVITNLPAAESSKLQPFATDWDLRQAITELLAREELQRAIRVEVRDQRVRLDGYVGDRSQADRVAQGVRAIPGVLSLDSKVVTDDQLGRAVEAKLRADPALASARIQVVAASGVVDITGEVPDRTTMRRIDTLAQQVDGAQVVHNMVVIRPAAISGAR